MERPGFRFLSGVFFISFSALLLEVSLIRVLSLIHSYSFAMLIVSVSLFGMAAGSSFLYLGRFKLPSFFCSIFFGLSSVFGYLAFSHIDFDPVKASYDYYFTYPLLLYYLLFSLPFFFFGMIVASAFKQYREYSGIIYFYNLLGSAAGGFSALVFIPLLGQHSITASAVFAVFAAYSFSKKRIQMALLPFILVLLLSISLPVNLSESKELTSALNIQSSKHLFSRWNSFSRIDVVDSPYTRYAPGLSMRYVGDFPDQLGILTDGAGMSAITIKNNYSYTEFLPSNIAYHLIPNPRILLVYPKAGPDIAAAIMNNASVTVVENNPLIVEAAHEHMDFAGDIYENLNIVYGGGRQHIKNSPGYDVIVLSLSGNVQGSGIYGVSQDYDLTVEGLTDYYHGLSDGGYIIITRWLSYPPKESLKLFSIAREVVPDNNIAMFRSWSTVTLVMGKNLNTSKIMEFTEKNRFDLLFLPVEFTPNVYSVFDEPLYHNYLVEIAFGKEFEKEYIFDISPATDDRPFYHNFFKITKMRELHEIMGGSWQPFNDPGFLLILLFIQGIFLSAVFIILPVLLRGRLPHVRIMYFFFIGIAYMLAEINLIQNFIRIFGNITHAAAFTITVMLLSSGIGSYMSKKIKLSIALPAIIMLILLFYFFIGSALSAIESIEGFTQILSCAILIAPLGFFMGMPFPLGLGLIEDDDVAWAFAVNGAASVLSTILALMLALFLGFSTVLLTAALAYFMAWVITSTCVKAIP